MMIVSYKKEKNPQFIRFFIFQIKYPNILAIDQRVKLTSTCITKMSFFDSCIIYGCVKHKYVFSPLDKFVRK